MSTQRQPKGAPAGKGGEFAANTHGEAETPLDEARPSRRDYLPEVKGVDWKEDGFGSGVSDAGVPYSTYIASRPRRGSDFPVSIAKLTVYEDGTILAFDVPRSAYRKGDDDARAAIRNAIPEGSLSPISHPFFRNRF